MAPRSFIIKSKMNGLVMDIKGGNLAQGNYIQMYEKHGKPNQCWILDEAHHVLRSKANQVFVLDVGAGGGLVIHKFVQTSGTQKWKIQGDLLVNIGTGQVADISGQNRAKGAKVIAYASNGGMNQKWIFESLASPAAPPPVKPATPAGKVVIHHHHHTPAAPAGAAAPPPYSSVPAPAGYPPLPQNPPYMPMPAQPTYPTGTVPPPQPAAYPAAPSTSTPGRNFMIRSRLNNLVLDIEGGQVRPGAKIVTYNQHGGDNQLWYIDPVRNTIRSKADDKLVIDIGPGGSLIVNTFVQGSPNQQWAVSGDSIRCLGNGQVADIAACNSAPGAGVIAYAPNGQVNQQWLLEYQPRRYFQIVSYLNHKVLDIGGNNKHAPGSPVYMYAPNQGDNQLWYEDQQGNIFSKLCGLTLKATPQGLITTPLNMADPQASWMKIGEQIENRSNPSQCLDIANANGMDRATVVAWDKNGGRNQAWYFKYV